VTAISGLLDIDKSGAFAGAAVKLTKAGEDYRAVWRAKAERGTRIHQHCESWLRGEAVEATDDEQPYLDALEKWMLTDAPVLLMSEGIVLSECGYGGRFDIIAAVGARTALIDVKTGSQYPVEHTLQLAAYRYADGIARYDAEGELDRVEPNVLRCIDWTGCLYLNGDGTYALIEYPADHDAFLTFRQLLDAHRWATSPTMKALTKEARK
jgi:hypothetical protein